MYNYKGPAFVPVKVSVQKSVLRAIDCSNHWRVPIEGHVEWMGVSDWSVSLVVAWCTEILIPGNLGCVPSSF